LHSVKTQKVGSSIDPIAVNLNTVVSWSVPRSSHLNATKTRYGLDGGAGRNSDRGWGLQKRTSDAVRIRISISRWYGLSP